MTTKDGDNDKEALGPGMMLLFRILGIWWIISIGYMMIEDDRAKRNAVFNFNMAAFVTFCALAWIVKRFSHRPR